jgi:hypothetical protein
MALSSAARYCARWPPRPSSAPACDEGLEHALVADAEVDPLAEIVERGEGALGARGDDRLGGAAADVADGAEAEADALVADHGELPARLVDVRREDLDPEVARLVDVLHHRVGVADAGREHRGHELRRVVRLEPGGLVREDEYATECDLLKP